MQSLIDQPAAWGLILGLLTPLLTSVVEQPHWTAKVRTVVAVLCAAAVGTVTVMAAGDVDPTNWLLTVGAVLAASQAAFHEFWAPAGVTQTVELKTAGRRAKARSASRASGRHST